MKSFFAPTTTKLLGALVVLAAIWVSEWIASYLWTSVVFSGAQFDEMTKRLSEQNPEELGKLVKQVFANMNITARMMVWMPVAQWLSRAICSYVAACAILAIGPAVDRVSRQDMRTIEPQKGSDEHH